MAENKTRPTEASVEHFIDTVEPERRREDGRTLLEIFTRLSGHTPKMWGPSIVGFGSCHYTYESGREGDMPMAAFSPRKANLVLYVAGTLERRPDLAARLGKHRTGKSCLYLNTLDDIDMAVLEELIAADIAHSRETYGTT